MPPPTWLTHHLEALGRSNPDGITRTARPARCRHCDAPILAGLDDDVAALPARVDPLQLDAAGELAALLTHRSTHRLHTDGDRWELQRRDQWQITASPPTPATLILAEHQCGRPLSSTWIPQPTKPTTSEGRCPF